jgi:hypothetical protein
MDTALAELARAGFDLAYAFDAHAVGVPQLVRQERVGILIGNTRALWPRLVAALAEPALAGEADPLDRYTEREIARAFPTAPVFYAHARYDGAFVPFQRVAVASGLAALAPSQLAVHPSYGPWFGLRAIVLVDGEPPVRAPIALPCRCDGRCEAAFERALQTPHDRVAWLAVRDACTLAAARYSDDQIAFHYARLGAPEGGTGDAAPHGVLEVTSS